MRKFIFIALMAFGPVEHARAAIVTDCESDCPDGQVSRSFGDGEQVSCICAEEHSMEETIPDTTVSSPGEHDAGFTASGEEDEDE